MTVVAILIIILAIRAAALPGLIRQQPDAAMALWPRSGAAQAASAMRRVENAGGSVDAAAATLARAALRREPLLASPLVVAGLAASERNDDARARRLFEEARRRDPRDAVTRYWLFDDYLRHGEYAAGIAEAAPIYRIRPLAGDAVVAVLTALLDVPAARPALAAALADNPPWRREFFAQAAASPRLQIQAVALLDHGDARAEAAIVAQMVRSGRIAAAYRLWQERLPVAYRGRAGAGIYDGDFVGWPGAAPFNWRLRGGRGVTVQPVGDGNPGVLVSGFAAVVQVAEQVVPLSAGRYRFAFQVKDVGSTPSGTGISGTVRCGTKTLARASAVPSGGEATTAEADVIVAADCPGATVRLAVAPGLEPGAFDLVVSGVRLSRGR